MPNVCLVKLTIFFFFFWPPRAARGISVPPPGIEPVSPAVEARSPNHWTTGEFPQLTILRDKIFAPKN